MDRVILHCDCNNFFASCECAVNPELWKVPIAVAGDPESRHGIICAKNQLAKEAGVKTAEPIWQAMRKCPNLVCVPAHFDLYHEFYEKINAIYLDYTDLVEPFSIDESYLDLTGCMHLFSGKTPKDIADEIRGRVQLELGITISVGVSFCKCFAKLGSDYKKPNATTVIMEEDVPRIVYPLPVTDLLFVGKKSADILHAHAVYTIEDLSHLSKEYLSKILGCQGEQLYTYVNCLDTEPVRSFYEKIPPKSVGNSMTFRRDISGEKEVRAGVSALADSVAFRLRAEKLKCTTIQITIRDPSFSQVQRQRKLSHPTYLQKEITDVAMQLIAANWDFKNPIRLLGVTGADLVDESAEVATQLSLFESNLAEDKVDTKKQEAIEDTMASLREKFGSDVIKLGYSENEELGIK